MKRCKLAMLAAIVVAALAVVFSPMAFAAEFTAGSSPGTQLSPKQKQERICTYNVFFRLLQTGASKRGLNDLAMVIPERAPEFCEELLLQANKFKPGEEGLDKEQIGEIKESLEKEFATHKVWGYLSGPYKPWRDSVPECDCLKGYK